MRMRAALGRAVLGMCLLPGVLSAQSSGPQVVSGGASFQQNGPNWNIQTTTNRTIINWKSFGVPTGSTTVFSQPGARSAVLNRVVGNNPSAIYGTLQSNGQVYLINPSGIVIGPSGQVKAAGFVASTLDVNDAQFLSGGSLTFSGDSTASVVNFGTISTVGGDVHLLGQFVENHGTILAPDGVAGLGAGSEILLAPDGNERIFIKPKQDSVGGTGVQNTGKIAAISAELKANGSAYALAINNGGSVTATGYEKREGHVYLRADGGSVVNTGNLTAKTVTETGATKGGEIQVLGKNVRIEGSAKLGASGELAGGKINVGGSGQGKGPLPNAEFSYIGEAVRLDASATVSGNGGAIVVWSDKATEVHGILAAHGGSTGGDGGFVEMSGAQLSVTGVHLDLTAPHGKTGRWLIDPDVFVVDAEFGRLLMEDLNVDGGGFLFADRLYINVPISASRGDLGIQARNLYINAPLSGGFRLAIDASVVYVQSPSMISVRMGTNSMSIHRVGKWVYSSQSNQQTSIAASIYSALIPSANADESPYVEVKREDENIITVSDPKALRNPRLVYIQADLNAFNQNPSTAGAETLINDCLLLPSMHNGDKELASVCLQLYNAIIETLNAHNVYRELAITRMAARDIKQRIGEPLSTAASNIKEVARKELSEIEKRALGLTGWNGGW